MYHSITPFTNAVLSFLHPSRIVCVFPLYSGYIFTPIEQVCVGVYVCVCNLWADVCGLMKSSK